MRIESRSSNSVCSERDAPFTAFPSAAFDVPLGRFASVSVRFRFASDGDVGAGGGGGGVRAPLVVVMVMAMAGAVGDAGAMAWRRATRSREECSVGGLHQSIHAAQEENG